MRDSFWSWLSLSMISASALLSGCSFMYDTDELRPFEPEPEKPPNADPNALEFTELSPLSMYEGMGDDGSRPALLVLTGSDFDHTTTVEITRDDGQPVAGLELVGDVSLERDLKRLAVLVSVKASSELATGEIPLTVWVKKPGLDGGELVRSLPWKLIALPELDVTETGYELNSETNNKLYSKVNIQAPIGVRGSVPLIVRSMSSLKIDTGFTFNLSATGSAGGRAGGEAGGKAGGPGFGFGRGFGGANGTDGGGAGFATPGFGGSASGPEVGDPFITSFGTNRGSGGGAGSVVLNLLGGEGGGSGGSIELTAAGELTIGNIASVGGVGGTAALGLGLGDGGGGSGGAIILRSGVKATVGELRANGGLGGNTPATSNRGADGRIRIDAPSLESSALASPTAVRGAMFDPGTPAVSDTQVLSLRLHGGAGTRFDIQHLNGADQKIADKALADFQGSNTLTVKIELQAGLNRLCTTPSGDSASVSNLESTNCIDVAYINPRLHEQY